MSQTDAAPAGAQSRWAARARGALTRYRVMAYVTGTMLLLLCAELIVHYAVGAGDDVMRWISWVPYAHGWIYIVYLVTVADLWSTMRWRYGRLAAMVLAGVVPVMSFVLEGRVRVQAEARLGREA